MKGRLQPVEGSAPSRASGLYVLPAPRQNCAVARLMEASATDTSYLTETQPSAWIKFESELDQSPFITPSYEAPSEKIFSSFPLLPASLPALTSMPQTPPSPRPTPMPRLLSSPWSLHSR